MHLDKGGAAHLFGFPLHHAIEGNFLETSWKHGVMAVQLLVSLLAGSDNLASVGNGDIVSAVGCSRGGAYKKARPMISRETVGAHRRGRIWVCACP